MAMPIHLQSTKAKPVNQPFPTQGLACQGGDTHVKEDALQHRAGQKLQHRSQEQGAADEDLQASSMPRSARWRSAALVVRLWCPVQGDQDTGLGDDNGYTVYGLVTQAML